MDEKKNFDDENYWKNITEEELKKLIETYKKNFSIEKIDKTILDKAINYKLANLCKKDEIKLFNKDFVTTGALNRIINYIGKDVKRFWIYQCNGIDLKKVHWKNLNSLQELGISDAKATSDDFKIIFEQSKNIEIIYCWGCSSVSREKMYELINEYYKERALRPILIWHSKE